MKMGIDIDGVIYDWGRGARNILLESISLPEELTMAQRIKLGSPEPEGHWDWIEEVVGKANFNWLWQNANEQAMFLRGGNFPGSADALAELAAKNDVYLITKRPPEARWQTFRWLGRMADATGNPAVKGVIHETNKAKLAGQLGLELVVDDNPDVLASYILKARGQQVRGLRVYGVQRPWNEGFSSSYYRFAWINGLEDLLERAPLIAA